MRVTGNSISGTFLTQLNNLLARQTRLQNQAATGQRIQAPEDDPSGMGQALSLQSEISRVQQYAQNISTLQTRAGTVSDVIQSIKTISDRVSEIATQADGTQPIQNLQNFAVEVRQLIQDAVRDANTQSNGQYVFGGTKSDQPPFAITTDANGNVTAVTYQGNTSVAQTEIAEGTTVSVEAPGQNSSGTGPRGVFGDSRYNADFFNHLIALQNHLQAGDSNAVATVDMPALKQDEDNIIYQAANSGVVQAQLQTAATDMDTRKAALQQSLTNVSGADLATTLVQLSQTQNAYQAALQSSARMLQLQQNLLSYLP